MEKGAHLLKMVPKYGRPGFFVTVNIKVDIPIHIPVFIHVHLHVHENLSFTNLTIEHSAHGLA